MNKIQAPGRGGAGGRRQGAAALRRGHRLGDFTIDGISGRGAFGVTYLGHDAHGDSVALKALDAGAAPDGPAAFRREAEILGLLRHRNIVALTRFEPDGDPPFMVIEPLGGPSLADALVEGTELPDLQVLLFGLLDALDHVHGAGFLHRDVKPGNVVLAGVDRPVLVDFGAALPIDARPGNATTRATPCYGALEQFVADGTEGPWTDLYGLAAIAYRLVTGAPPPPALDRADGAAMKPAAKAVGGDYPEAVLAAIDWALEMPVHRRPQSVRDWRSALSGAWLPTDTVVPLSTPDKATKAPAEAPVDDYPPTEEITRVTPPARRASRKVPLDLPVAPGPSRRPQPAARRGGGAGWIWALLCVVLLAGGAAGGYFFGWPYYLRNIKSEWLVDAAGGGDVRTITEALETAKEGALVEVRPGTYPESLAIVRPVTLTGLGVAADGEPAVTVAPETGACLDVGAAPATVTGFAFQGGASPGGGACIELRTAADFQGNRVEAAAGPAVHVGGGADPILAGNRLAAIAAPALLIDTGAVGQVRDNTIASTEGPGIVVTGAAPAIESNRIEGTGLAGIVYDGAGAGRLADNTIGGTGASGIEIRGRSNPEIVGNRIEATLQAGIFVFDGGSGRIDGNTITGNAFSGVVIGAGGRPTLTGNTIVENAEHGVLVLGGGGGELRSNTIERNGGFGVAMEKDVKIALEANLLSGNREPQIRGGGVVQPFPDDPDLEAEAGDLSDTGPADDLGLEEAPE